MSNLYYDIFSMIDLQTLPHEAKYHNNKTLSLLSCGLFATSMIDLTVIKSTSIYRESQKDSEICALLSL